MKKFFAIASALAILSPLSAFAISFNPLTGNTDQVYITTNENCNVLYGNWYTSENESSPFSGACPDPGTISVSGAGVSDDSIINGGGNCVDSCTVTVVISEDDCSGLDLATCLATVNTNDSFNWVLASLSTGFFSLPTATVVDLQANVSDTIGSPGMMGLLVLAIGIPLTWFIIDYMKATAPGAQKFKYRTLREFEKDLDRRNRNVLAKIDPVLYREKFTDDFKDTGYKGLIDKDF